MSESRYDDPAYQEQVAKQMLATPTHLIACRAITDLRTQLAACQELLLAEQDKVSALEQELDAQAWKIPPAMAQAQIDQLNTRAEQAERERVRLSSDYAALMDSFEIVQRDLATAKAKVVELAEMVINYAKVTNHLLKKNLNEDVEYQRAVAILKEAKG